MSQICRKSPHLLEESGLPWAEPPSEAVSWTHHLECEFRILSLGHFVTVWLGSRSSVQYPYESYLLLLVGLCVINLAPLKVCKLTFSCWDLVEWKWYCHSHFLLHVSEISSLPVAFIKHTGEKPSDTRNEVCLITLIELSLYVRLWIVNKLMVYSNQPTNQGHSFPRLNPDPLMP